MAWVSERVTALANGLVAVHVAFWLALVVSTPRLPAEYFVTPDSWEVHTATGVEFHLRSGTRSMLVLAERGFGGHYWEDGPLKVAAILVNLPGALFAALTSAAFEGRLGLRAASWVATGVFVVVSCAQWWAIGWAGAAYLNRRKRRVAAPASEHP